VGTSILPVPATHTHTSPESAEVQRERSRTIINSAIAMIDGDDVDAIEPSMAHPQPPTPQ
jgi:hypothetical protein